VLLIGCLVDFVKLLVDGAGIEIACDLLYMCIKCKQAFHRLQIK